ncbi:Dual specificity phosphatase, catalytic domain [Rhodoblastus acidophilus]|uniref:protein-tyrosine-phosphatase n=1 Tax=Rhodoblastus acidophilus TaxID=1074 RepID=A0A212RU47_RHOAC|nr:cyclin-dependent kinase inhibitor 3 family protein [Rhodoblastus acidophilus]SNB76077.1 Dual specificity phosphatase, catalytic domain [Rhodoblastus acidophilus]
MTLARTSQTHPLQIAHVRATPAHGRIGITFCPGKHDKSAHTGAWARDLAADLDVIADSGARLVLTLVEPAELAALKVESLGAEVLARGLDWRHLPIADYSVPSAVFERLWRAQGRELRALLRRGGDIVVHCKGGLGRAGMIAARLLAELGVDPAEAIKQVRQARKGAIETPSQLSVVRRTRPVLDVEEIDTTRLRKVGGTLGSNPGGLFEDAEGRRYYVKTLESAAHARNEMLAAKFYQLAGAPTLTYLPARDPTEVATEFVVLEKKTLGEFDAEALKQARRWFGVHAWTANWDAAGYLGDNQGVVEGVVVTLDVGGALAFRAQGDPKGKAFGPVVGELDSLRGDEDNPHAKKLFSAMSRAELAESIAVVTRIPDAAIRRMVADNYGGPALAEKMIARKADMAARLA